MLLNISCDLCQKEHLEFSMRCDNCDYDECFNCIKKKIDSTKKILNYWVLINLKLLYKLIIFNLFLIFDILLFMWKLIQRIRNFFLLNIMFWKLFK